MAGCTCVMPMVGLWPSSPSTESSSSPGATRPAVKRPALPSPVLSLGLTRLGKFSLLLVDAFAYYPFV
jgi:hypothetical protein